jgi:hypothetical protein
MKTILSLLVVAAMSLSSAMAGVLDPQTLFETYDTFRMMDVSGPKMNHAELLRHIETLKQAFHGELAVEIAGYSSEGRSINLLTLGRGAKKIFLWSQMHGDEPTATMALMDVLTYLSKNRTSPEVQSILKETTLLFLPMLNPDGAERFQRWSVHGIDINRDARRLQTSEARTLKAVRDRFNPQFGFNLHDQDSHVPVGNTSKAAAIALLAPAYDEAKSDNAVRVRAKKVAAVVASVLSRFVEGYVARYDDTFEPRAFGDNIQSWGTSTVLIESGGWKDDPEKQFLRKLNAVVLLSVFSSIANDAYERANIASYEELPENGKRIYDLVITGIKLVGPDSLAPITVDIGLVQRSVRDKSGVLHLVSRVSEIGDLSFSSAIERLDGSGESLPLENVKLEKAIYLDELIARLKKK